MQNRVDAKKLKAQLALTDYENILHELGIPLYSKNSTNWIYWTGDKNINPYNGSPKLYFYPDTKVYMSWTASRSYDIIGLVQQRLSLLKKDCSFIDAVNEIIRITGIDTETISRINSNRFSYNWEEDLGRFIRFNKYGTDLQVYNPRILDELEQSIPQAWLDEGISVEAMIKYRIGYYQRLNCTTIPCHDANGNLIGIRTRNWNPEDIEAGRKYMPLILLDGTTYKFNTNNTFYGINFNGANIEATSEVILCESEKSVLMAESVYGDHSNVLALYGSQLGKLRRNQLIKMGVRNVILALDSDFHVADYSDEEFVAFEKKIIKFAEQFKGYCSVEVIYNNIGLDGYKYSPFDFGVETYNKLYENRETVI